MQEREAGQGGVDEPKSDDWFWSLFSARHIALSDAVFGKLVWRDGQWMYSRRRYPLWWHVLKRVCDAAARLGDWLQSLEPPLIAGKEYFEPANLTPDVEAHIAGFKDPGKVKFVSRAFFCDREEQSDDIQP